MTGLGETLGDALAQRRHRHDFVARIEGEAGAHAVALNTPYAGGHILDRHGDPAADVHALQLELDRSLYLNARFDRPGGGFTATAAMLRRMIAALADEALGGGLAVAAE